MSACFWSGRDERKQASLGGLDRGRGGDHLSILFGLRQAAIFPSQLLRQLRRAGPGQKYASGNGIVYATSLVCRAATPQTRAHVPYNIVLVDTVEGFRMMAHGDIDLAIGDKVTARFVQFAGHLVPCFTRTTS